MISETLPESVVLDHLVGDSPDFPDSLKNLGASNQDGWGLAYYDTKNAEFIVFRGEPPASSDPEFDVSAREVAASGERIAVGHVRNAASGAYEISDPHPFIRYRGGKNWALAHNGVLDKDKLKSLIGEDYLSEFEPTVGDDWNDWQVVDTDLYMIYILKCIEASGWDVRTGIAKAVVDISKEDSGGMNIFLTDGEILWGFRKGTSLYYLYDSEASSPYCALASQPPEGEQGNWVYMNDWNLVELTEDADPVVIDVLDYDPSEGNETFSFTITCDMRYETDPGEFPAVLDAITATGGPGVFMVVLGDLDPPWKVDAALDEEFGTSFDWYPVVGNHELEDSSYVDWIRNEFSNLPYIVNSGPTNCENTTYSFDYGNAHFVVLNEYYDGSSDTGTDGDIVPALYDWLEADLEATNKKWIFVTGHEPVYPQPDAYWNDSRHVGDSLDKYPANRDAFWALLDSYNVTAYLCGHTHRYSRFLKDGVWQVDAAQARGTGPYDTFLRVTVENSQVTFETYRSLTGTFSLTDSWRAGAVLKPFRVLIVIDIDWGSDPQSYVASTGWAFQDVVTLLKLWSIPLDILRLDNNVLNITQFVDAEGKPKYGAIIWNCRQDRFDPTHPNYVGKGTRDWSVLETAVITYGISLITLANTILEPRIRELLGINFMDLSDSDCWYRMTDQFVITEDHFITRGYDGTIIPAGDYDQEGTMGGYGCRVGFNTTRASVLGSQGPWPQLAVRDLTESTKAVWIGGNRDEIFHLSPIMANILRRAITYCVGYSLYKTYPDTILLRIDDPGAAQTAYLPTWQYPQLTEEQIRSSIIQPLLEHNATLAVMYTTGYPRHTERTVLKSWTLDWVDPYGTRQNLTSNYLGILEGISEEVLEIQSHGWTHMQPDLNSTPGPWWDNPGGTEWSNTEWYREYYDTRRDKEIDVATQERHFDYSIQYTQEAFGTFPLSFAPGGDAISGVPLESNVPATYTYKLAALKGFGLACDYDGYYYLGPPGDIVISQMRMTRTYYLDQVSNIRTRLKAYGGWDIPIIVLFHDRDIALEPNCLHTYLHQLEAPATSTENAVQDYMGHNEFVGYMHAKPSALSSPLGFTFEYDDHYCKHFATHNSTWTLHLSDAMLAEFRGLGKIDIMIDEVLVAEVDASTYFNETQNLVIPHGIGTHTIRFVAPFISLEKGTAGSSVIFENRTGANVSISAPTGLITETYYAEEVGKSKYDYERKVTITEPGVQTRIDEPVEVYVTFDHGQCYSKDSILVTYWNGSARNEVPSQVYNVSLWEDSTAKSATILWNINIGLDESKDYYIYYDKDGEVASPNYVGLSLPKVENRGTSLNLATEYGTGDTIKVKAVYEGVEKNLVWVNLKAPGSYVAWDDWYISPGIFHLWVDGSDVFEGGALTGEASTGPVCEHSDGSNYARKGSASSVTFEIVGPLLIRIRVVYPSQNPGYGDTIPGTFTDVYSIYYTPDFKVTRIKIEQRQEFPSAFDEAGWGDWTHLDFPAWDVTPVQTRMAYQRASGTYTESLTPNAFQGTQHSDWTERWIAMFNDASITPALGLFFTADSRHSMTSSNYRIMNVGGFDTIWGIHWFPSWSIGSTISGDYDYEFWWIATKTNTAETIRNEYLKTIGPVSITVGDIESAVEPVKYSLTIESTPISGVEFVLGDASYMTPFMENLYEEEYLITMPESCTVDEVTYEFKRWADGHANRTRIVNLNQNLTLTAEFELHFEVMIVSSEYFFSNMVTNTPVQLNFTIVTQHSMGAVNVTIQIYSYSSASYVTTGQGHLTYISSETPYVNETKVLLITIDPQIYVSNGNAKVKITSSKNTTTQFEQKINMVKLEFSYTVSDYDYVLKVINPSGKADKTARLMVYDSSNVERLESLTISFYDGTVSDQITISGGTINQPEGPLFDLPNGTTLYIRITNVHANAPGTSYIYINLEVSIPNTTTSKAYTIILKID